MKLKGRTSLFFLDGTSRKAGESLKLRDTPPVNSRAHMPRYNNCFLINDYDHSLSRP